MTTVVPRDDDYMDWTQGGDAVRERLEQNRKPKARPLPGGKRTLDQNAVFHIWCREIAEHYNAKVRAMTPEEIAAYIQEHDERPKLTSPKLIKGLVKYALGNVFRSTLESLHGPVIMDTSDYKMTEAELTPTDRKHEFITMDQFMTRVQAWAATDLGLELKVEVKE